ncbi:hypothetical protein [Cognatilysobacter segetis]|uniref:hypothetical protein n=1 Tax=Cognatilysobacter segetis TaxID=2492394 RepID=UPI0010613510|nr:hypothetical protein [Lysobacter segetis]
MFAAISLIVVAGLVAIASAVLEVLSPSELWGVAGAFRTGFYAALLLGAMPALLLGAPAYWLLWRAGRARWRSALPVGAALGALVLLVEPGLAGWGIVCGMLVAALTHVAAARWLAPAIASTSPP